MMLLFVQTLDEMLQDEEDPHKAKVKVSYILMRYLATLTTLFHEYRSPTHINFQIFSCAWL